ncbi:MAG: zinc ribbon domain-containing protein [Anaerolineae bacterium]|nr:zinc ribbon domain-containing protein [Anaerolineae bacterium]
MRICPNCKNQVSGNAVFCDQCGSKLPAEEPIVQEQAVEAPTGSVPEGIVICPGCGAENVPGEIFCDICGEPLETPAPAEIAADEITIGEAAAQDVVEEEIVEEDVVEEAVIEEVVIEEPEIEEPATETAEAGELYCAVCGSVVYAGDTFCGSCGAALAEMAAEETVVAEEPIMEEEIALVEDAAIEEAVIEEAVIEEVDLVEEPIIEEPVIEEVVVEEAIIEEEAAIEEAVLEDIQEPPAIEVAGESATQAFQCAVCGAIVQPGQAFCASCGAAQQAPGAAVQVEPEVIATGPYLEVVESGAHIPLILQPELLVGRLDEASGIEPEVDMTPHGGLDGGVSRRHAKLLYEGGAWFVIDLDSTNGTFINGDEVTPKARAALSDGDKVEFGEVEAIFHAG